MVWCGVGYWVVCGVIWTAVKRHCTPTWSFHPPLLSLHLRVQRPVLFECASSHPDQCHVMLAHREIDLLWCLPLARSINCCHQVLHECPCALLTLCEGRAVPVLRDVRQCRHAHDCQLMMVSHQYSQDSIHTATSCLSDLRRPYILCPERLYTVFRRLVRFQSWAILFALHTRHTESISGRYIVRMPCHAMPSCSLLLFLSNDNLCT